MSTKMNLIENEPDRIHKKCVSSISKPQNFWTIIKLYLDKPHTVNKRLAGSVPVSYFKLNNEISVNKFMELSQHLRSQPEITGDILINCIKQHDIDAIKCPGADFEDLINTSNQNNVLDRKSVIILRRLLPKNKNLYKAANELVLLNFTTKSIAFVSVSENHDVSPFLYTITLMSDNTISVEAIADEFDKKLFTWMSYCLLPKLVKWCDQEELNQDVVGLVSNVQSLSMVDIEEYNDLYNDLKTKYGLNMVKIWPESTDPSKFVYEDIAIATYLLLIWRQERSRNGTTKLQSFVDLGCGNGLLVYILSSEGHAGYGVDIRKRGIWDMYPESTILKIETVIPSDKTVFPNTDWIIGNHSDELSAWIPVMACRNSFQTNFFVLPCCPFEFDGTKYQRRNGHMSQYQDFLEYMIEISNVCGFETKVDRLKIPSTKRCAIIGVERTWKEDELTERCKNVEIFINQRTRPIKCDDSWDVTFKPRDSVEKVQNCTKIDKNVQQDITKIIFDQLLLKKRYVEDFVNSEWNFGGIVALSDLVRVIPSELLKKLKSECGGLQTLLRNNHQIFQVQQGKVQIRKPVSCSDRLLEQSNRKGKEFFFKQKECWFRLFHPDGCPFSDEDCTFKHLICE